MFIFIITVTVALTISFMCSLLEACLLSLSVTDIAKISEKNQLAANMWKRFKENIQKPIAVILIVNTFSHTIGAALSGSQFNDLFGHKWIILYSILFSLVMIQWTEILPKVLGVKYNRLLAALTAIPMNILIRLFTPMLAVIQFFNRPFERKIKTDEKINALDDISVLAHFAAVHNLISKEQVGIVERGISLSNKKTSDVFIKRGEMKYLSTKISLSEALIQAHIHHHTRFPLINGDNVDEIVGYINFKDIVNALRLNPSDPSLKGISRPILSVGPDENLSVLLNTLIKGYQHIAVVKDKSGKVLGLVTLEDIIESIVGQINDEYDILPEYFYPITETRFIAGGGIKISVLNEKLNENIRETAITLNDWLIKMFKRIPKSEDRINRGNIQFTVRKISRSKIHEVIIDEINAG